MNKINLNINSLIFKEGAIADKLYIVKSGEVLCLKSSKDRLIPVYLAKEGDIIGESAMMEHSNHTYSAIAVELTQVIEIPSLQFQKVFAEAPEWLISLTSSMISRFQKTSNLIAENRMIHPLIINEDHYTSKIETLFKKLVL